MSSSRLTAQDKYERTLADVVLFDGMNVNHELVKEDSCWWYRKYAPGDTILEGLEKEARDTKKGLWVNPAPFPRGSIARLGVVKRPTCQTSCREKARQRPALAAAHRAGQPRCVESAAVSAPPQRPSPVGDEVAI